jgi:competence protein ComEA
METTSLLPKTLLIFGGDLMSRKQMTLRALILVIGVSMVGAGFALGIWPFSDEDRRVNINTADQVTLAALPGVDEAKAEAIIEYRDRNGPFKTVEDVEQVFGINEQVFAELKAKITVEEEEQSPAATVEDREVVIKEEPAGQGDSF